MSLDLRDLRAKITPETWCWLEATHRITGRDIAEIVREHLHDIALNQLRIASVANRLLDAEGLSGSIGDRQGGASR